MRRVLPACVFAAVAATALAGPLAPPAGPVASTGRFGPRIEVNAANTPGTSSAMFRITQPGSYYLGANVTGEPFKHGIQIASNDVVLDLNGFGIDGVFDALDGVHVEQAGFMPGIVVRNGSIYEWPGDGVNADVALGITLEDLSIFFCQNRSIGAGEGARLLRCHAAGSGVIEGGDNCIIKECRASTIGDGFEFGAGTVIEQSVAHDCASIGFQIVSGTISGCVANENGAGFRVSGSAALSECVARLNSDYGFDCCGSTIASCYADQNGANGFFLVDSSAVGSFAAQNGSNGFILTTSTVVGCGSYLNTQAGFDGRESHLESCMARLNTVEGFEVTGGSSVVSCTAVANATGFVVGVNSRVVASAATIHFGSGILVTGRESLIDGNYLANNGLGIEVTADRNLIIRNLARDNSGVDYDIIPGNRVGVISIPPLSGDISTPADPDALGAGTTDPWANISF